MSREIFLIEDDIDHAELITTFLKVGGIENEIIWFKDAETALERLNTIDNDNENPSLIIIDLKLPRMDGFQLLSHIKAIDKLAKIPIIVISSSSRSSDIGRALDLGAEEFINKLAEMDKLSSRVKEYL